MKSKNKKEMFLTLLNSLSDALSNAGCNDFDVENNPENYHLIELSSARNLRCKSLEEFKKHPEYEDYKPNVSKDGKTIHTSDYVILEILKSELGLK